MLAGNTPVTTATLRYYALGRHLPLPFGLSALVQSMKRAEAGLPGSVIYSVDDTRGLILLDFSTDLAHLRAMLSERFHIIRKRMCLIAGR